MPAVIHTVGHSPRTADELVALLESFGIRLLVDVRRFPGSRRHPQFNAETLAPRLAEHAIDYRHEEALGGRRSGATASSSSYWRNRSFRAYADHMLGPEFREALARVERYASEGRLAIMCAEALHWRCHRNLIADALTLHGFQVRHIVAPGRADAHRPNPAARVEADGRVRYRDPSAVQEELGL